MPWFVTPIWRPGVCIGAHSMKDYSALPGGRHWHSDVPVPLSWTLQRGIMNYRYRDVPMLKPPVEIALYMRLIWEAKPGTIIEIGTQKGGAAIWMANSPLAPRWLAAA